MPDTWKSRLQHALGPGGYHEQMRRSLQSVILYEAHRAVEPCFNTLRPYQRKAAYMEQCSHLLDSLDAFLLPHQRAEVMYRTMSSQTPLDGTAAFTRYRGIQQELEQLSEQIKQFYMPGVSHEEAVNQLAQHLFETRSGGIHRGRVIPAMWEHANNHVLLVFRLYYQGPQVDPNFPPPSLMVNLQLIRKQPRRGNATATTTTATSTAITSTAASPFKATTAYNDVDRTSNTLKEVREYLELLKEFEGTIPEEEIAQRKRDLFLSMPPVPAKRNKTEN